MYSCEPHEDLLSYWFKDLISKRTVYREPTLNEFVMNKIKLFCDGLQQDTHVFLSAVEILERYIGNKNKKQIKIEDPFLLIITTIYLCSKYTGELSDFKTGSLINLYTKLTMLKITNRQIKLMEIDIFKTLDNNLPNNTRIDDLKMFLECYKLDIDLGDLCELLLIFFSIYNVRLFASLKIRYSQNIEAYKAFMCIYTNRLYLPIGILLSAMKITNFSREVDVKAIADELCVMSGIHCDHLFFLRDQILKLWTARKRAVKKLQVI